MNLPQKALYVRDSDLRPDHRQRYAPVFAKPVSNVTSGPLGVALGILVARNEDAA